MADISAIRAAIKSNLSTITTAERFDYEPKNTPAAAAIIVSWPDQYDPRATLAGDIDLTIPVRVELPWSDDESSDAALMTLMGSVVAAIESDRTLGGACDDLSCGPFTNIGARTLPDETTIMQFVVPVEIFA